MVQLQAEELPPNRIHKYTDGGIDGLQESIHVEMSLLRLNLILYLSIIIPMVMDKYNMDCQICRTSRFNFG